MNLLGFGKQNLPSIIKDPFGKKQITGITVRCHEGYGGKWSATGYVYFQNGNTSGEQKFEGQTFDEVVLQIKAMMESF